jgi:hypothetical protein
VKTVAAIALMFILPFTIQVALAKVTLPIAFVLAALLMSKIK